MEKNWKERENELEIEKKTQLQKPEVENLKEIRKQYDITNKIKEKNYDIYLVEHKYGFIKYPIFETNIGTFYEKEINQKILITNYIEESKHLIRSLIVDEIVKRKHIKIEHTILCEFIKDKHKANWFITIPCCYW